VCGIQAVWGCGAVLLARTVGCAHCLFPFGARGWSGQGCDWPGSWKLAISFAGDERLAHAPGHARPGARVRAPAVLRTGDAREKAASRADRLADQLEWTAAGRTCRTGMAHVCEGTAGAAWLKSRPGEGGSRPAAGGARLTALGGRPISWGWLQLCHCWRAGDDPGRCGAAGGAGALPLGKGRGWCRLGLEKGAASGLRAGAPVAFDHDRRSGPGRAGVVLGGPTAGW